MAKPAKRDFDDGDPVVVGGVKAYYDQSWAVVIGINRYAPEFRTLRYAVSDAVAIAETLITKRGFQEDHVFLVLDPIDEVPSHYQPWLQSVRQRLGHFSETGTKKTLEKLIFTALRERVHEDDRVLVYFAGHGVSEPMPDGGPLDAAPYLVPADAGAKQWDEYIDLIALVRRGAHSRAKHIFYLLDACASGLLGLRAGVPPTRYEQDMLLRKARQCLTAGTAEQLAEDGGINGHSTFTHNVLQVLRGDVQLGDGLVTATNLTAHVKRAVAGSASQTPDGFPVAGHGGGEFIFYAPKAALGLEERAALAQLLTDDVSWRLDEPSPVELATQMWHSIVGVAPTEEVAISARCRKAGALLALGKAADALALLEHASLKTHDDAKFLRGLAYLKTKQLDAAQTVFQEIAAAHGHPYSLWAKSAAEAAGKRRSKRYALLVGVERYAKNPRLELRGCGNDVRALREVLETQLEFDVVRCLLNEDATSKSIKAEFETLARGVRPEDSFVFYFSGNGFVEEQVALFATHDLDINAGVALTEHAIDACMKAIPARDKLIITDGCHLAPSASVPPRGYRYLFGCGRAETAYEVFTEQGIVRGAFTYALERALRTYGNGSLEELKELIVGQLAASLATLQGEDPQTPGYVGNGSETFVRDYHPAFEAVDLAMPSCVHFSANQLADLASWMHANKITAKPLWLGLGRAWLAKERYKDAMEALTAGEPASASLPLIKAQLMSGAYREALTNLTSLVRERSGYADEGLEHGLAELPRLLERMIRPAGHALLVGVGADTLMRWTSNPSPQLSRIKQLLLHAGFSDVRIASEPSQVELLAAFDELIARAGDTHAFFLFIGPGFNDRELWLSSADEAQHQFSDLPLSMLRERAASGSDLTAAIFLTQRRGPRRHTRNVTPAPSGLPDLPALGSTTIVAAPAVARDLDGLGESLPPELPKLLEVLTTEVDSLRVLSARQWLARAGSPAGVTIRGDETRSLFSHRTDRSSALGLYRLIEHAPLRQAEALLTRLTDDREFAASAWLHRGILRAALGRHVEALDDIDAALERHRADRANDTDVEDRSGATRWAEAHYHRGKILLDAGRYSEAEAALARAIDQDRDHARAHYYRARAIRRLIEANLEQQARKSAQRYVALGAPLGLDEVVAALVT